MTVKRPKIPFPRPPNTDSASNRHRKSISRHLRWILDGLGEGVWLYGNSNIRNTTKTETTGPSSRKVLKAFKLRKKLTMSDLTEFLFASAGSTLFTWRPCSAQYNSHTSTPTNLSNQMCLVWSDVQYSCKQNWNHKLAVTKYVNQRGTNRGLVVLTQLGQLAFWHQPHLAQPSFQGLNMKAALTGKHTYGNAQWRKVKQM